MTILVKFAQCMRSEGIDYPDPKLGQGGAISMGAGRGSPPGPEQDAALARCDPILKDGLGQGLRPDPAAAQEQLDRMLVFARCMRAHGVDYPDPKIVNGRPSLGAGTVSDTVKFEEAMADCNSGPGGPVMMSGPPGQTGGSTGSAP